MGTAESNTIESAIKRVIDVFGGAVAIEGAGG